MVESFQLVRSDQSNHFLNCNMHVGFEHFLIFEHILQTSTPSSKCHWALQWLAPQPHPEA
jgi:hypothetical protein